jgi:hypothetical protein
MSLDEEGLVEDNSEFDRDSEFESINVIYNITAPQTPGQYTLWLFAASHKPSSNSTQLLVNVHEHPSSVDIYPLIILGGVTSVVVLSLFLARLRFQG